VNDNNYVGIVSGVISQFFGSLLLGYVASQFRAKYKENDWRKLWLGIYVFMVFSSIMILILGIYPLS